MQRTLGTTTIYVTHDQVEAMTMADRIAVLNNGELQQFGAPMTLYKTPANIFVAGFIGSPSMNFMTGNVGIDNNFDHVESNTTFSLPYDLETGRSVTIGIRPEDIHIDKHAIKAGPPATFTANVLTVELMGNESILYIEAGNNEFIARTTNLVDIEPGTVVDLYIDTSKLHVFDSTSGDRIKG